METKPMIVSRDEHAPRDELLGMLERVACNPDVPVEKMERLLAMQERILAKQSEDAFNAAMSAAQSEMVRIAADSTNPQTRSRYASYGALDRVLRPIFTKHGFALSFGEQDSPKPDSMRVVCFVTHRAGHTRIYHRDMPNDGKGAKGGDVMTRTHAAGAAQSYGMRYLLKGIFNVAIGDDDTDGNPPDVARINATEAADVEALIEEVGANRDKFLAFYSIKTVAELPQRDLVGACAELRRRVRR